MNRVPPIFAGVRRKWLLGLCANGLARGGLAAVSAVLIGHAFGAKASTHGIGALLLFLGAALAAALLKAHEAVLAERLGQDYAAGVRMQLFEHLIRASPEATRSLDRGGLMLRFVTDLNGLRSWAAQGLAQLWSSGAMLLAAFGLLALRSPMLALAAGGGVLAVMLALFLGGKRLRSAERRLRRRRGRLASRAHRKLSALNQLQRPGRGERETERMRKKSEAVAQASVERARTRGLLRGIAEAGAWFALLGVGVAGDAGLRSGALTLPQVLSALSLAGLLSGPLLRIERAVEIHHGHRIARQKLDRLLALPPAEVLPEKPRSSPRGPLPLTTTLE
ncbi:MAG: ABC transporter transmembrane domain-containing protein [Lysobacter sp.]